MKIVVYMQNSTKKIQTIHHNFLFYLKIDFYIKGEIHSEINTIFSCLTLEVHVGKQIIILTIISRSLKVNF